jgi:hypothetical protein
MAVANRVQLSQVVEVTLGTTPVTPRMRGARFTGESLQFNQDFVDSDEIRSDRMLGDPIKVMASSGGAKNIELSYPVDNSPESNDLASAFYAAWVNTPTRDNDGTADSIITGLATAGTVATVTTGAAFVTGQLVKFTNFAVANNNGTFKCTTGSATVPAFVASGITDETAPPATARMKVVGFVGAAGDVTAAAGGLASTALNFTTLGLVPGMWLKIGGTAVGDKFTGTAANNDWVRISGTITATSIPCDNLPVGWSVDAGAAKTIKVWFGDYIQNGTTQLSQSIERGFMDQTTPTYIVNSGMVVNTYDLSISSKQKITGSVNYIGMGGSQGTVALDATIDANTTGAVMAANANVGRVAEAGATLTSPNWVKDLKFQINNNNRALEAVDSASPVGVNMGECSVSGTVNVYFGSNALLTKFYAGTVTALNSRVVKNSQALIWQFPRVTYKTSGNPNASGKNTDVMVDFGFQAAIDTVLTNKQVQLDRIESFEV